MSREPSQPDFFDRARAVAATGMLAAGSAAILGSLLDWITVVRKPRILPDSELERAASVSGVEATDGWWIVALAVVIVNCGLLLWMRRRSLWAWIGFLCSIVIGGIAIADYQAIGERASGLLQRLDVVGELDRGVGILIVLASAILGVIFSLFGIAATPSDRRPS